MTDQFQPVIRSLFVLGGARSGKSRYAQARAEASPLDLVFVATAEPFDDEMAERITRHQADRGPRWSTVEARIELAGAILEHSRPDRLLLIDCLTLWTSNLMLSGRDITVATEELQRAISTAAGPIIFVANEVGLGIVPDNALARRFRDEAGRINQAVAVSVDEAQLIVAGLPVRLK
ncbi:MAG: bifunctional adenosylcobinamide kinase/adenosylcobinamide-phosphate guanylyltransferase [Novosphingobium sp.]